MYQLSEDETKWPKYLFFVAIGVGAFFGRALYQDALREFGGFGEYFFDEARAFVLWATMIFAIPSLYVRLAVELDETSKKFIPKYDAGAKRWATYTLLFLLGYWLNPP